MNRSVAQLRLREEMMRIALGEDDGKKDAERIHDDMGIEERLAEWNGEPIAPAEQEWECFICGRANTMNKCDSCKADEAYWPTCETLLKKKMRSLHGKFDRHREEEPDWKCDTCGRQNHGEAEVCYLCGGKCTRKHKKQSSWWSWKKSLELSSWVKEDRDALEEQRYVAIQRELQERQEAIERESKRQADEAEKERLRILHEEEMERRREEAEEARQQQIRERIHAEEAHARKLRQQEAAKRKTMIQKKLEARVASGNAVFGKQKAAQKNVIRTKIERKRKHMAWLKEKLARDALKKKEADKKQAERDAAILGLETVTDAAGSSEGGSAPLLPAIGRKGSSMSSKSGISFNQGSKFNDVLTSSVLPGTSAGSVGGSRPTTMERGDSRGGSPPGTAMSSVSFRVFEPEPKTMASRTPQAASAAAIARPPSGAGADTSEATPDSKAASCLSKQRDSRGRAQVAIKNRRFVTGASADRELLRSTPIKA
eukprot:g20.t1